MGYFVPEAAGSGGVGNQNSHGELFSASRRRNVPSPQPKRTARQAFRVVASATSTPGMRYYGYRYYNPELGRWVNRDPIEEWGGINVYGLAINDKANHFDMLGLLFWTDVHAARIEIILDTYWDVTRVGHICKCELLYEDERCSVTATGCVPGSEYWEYVATERSDNYLIRRQTEAFTEVLQTSQLGQILELILGVVISGGIRPEDAIPLFLGLPGLHDLVPSDFRTVTRDGSSIIQNYARPIVEEAGLPECTFDTLWSYAIEVTKTVRRELVRNVTPIDRHVVY